MEFHHKFDRETNGILVEQQPPHGVFICDHAGPISSWDSRGLFGGTLADRGLALQPLDTFHGQIDGQT